MVVRPCKAVAAPPARRESFRRVPAETSACTARVLSSTAEGTAMEKARVSSLAAALLAAAAELKERPFTKVIAIYPRNVLLADQLREALSEAGKLQPVLARFGLRPLRFGTLLGGTPWKGSFERKEGDTFAVEKWHGWQPVGAAGFRIPFLKSPLRPGEDLVWRNATSGRYVVWHMDAAGVRTSGRFVNPPAPDVPLGWTIAGPR